MRTLLDAARTGPQALVLEGVAGIGKTAIWRHSLRLARECGYRVLSCRPGGAEVQLGFAALGDLLDPVADAILPLLSEPRRRALNVALLHDDGPELNPRVVGVSLLDTLRRLAEQQPLLIGIDDLQWLDLPTAHVLEFALRRLSSEPIAVIACERAEEANPLPLSLEQALGDERAKRLRIGPLSLGATHELLRSRLGTVPGRTTLIRLHEASGGNAFVALELARELRRRGADPQPAEPLPLPTGLQELVVKRLAELPAPAQCVLLAAGALSRPTVEQLVRFDGGAEHALRVAERAGIVEVDGTTVRFTHPLLALIPYDELEPAARRRLHRRLADVVDNAEERARHAALSVAQPDAGVAAALDAAALGAGARGAPESAAELCVLAGRLTPTKEEEARWERLLTAAEWYQRAGDLPSAGVQAEAALAGTMPSQAITRARALTLLGTVRGDTEGLDAAIELYNRALRERGATRELRAEIHQKLAWIRFGGGQAESAVRHARAAVRLVDPGDPAVEAAATATAAMIEAARRGRVPRRLLDRALELEQAERSARPSVWAETLPGSLEGVVLLWAGELESAREPLERMHAGAIERGDPWLLMHSLAYLSSLESAGGRPRRGLELARRYLELASETGQDAQRAGALWPLSLAATWLGLADEARAAASEALQIAERTGHRLYVIGSLSTLGLLELSLGKATAAAPALRRAEELARESGIAALGRFCILPNAVEALLGAGEFEQATTLASELQTQAAALARPWALALADRCVGLVAAARGDWQGAVSSLERALAAHVLQDRSLEHARTQLALGTALRRVGRKRDARSTIEVAVETFDAAGASLWAKRGGEELRRIGGRHAPSRGELSATEARIAELVASGRTNAEAASMLHLSPRTVEWNLSKVYRKLSVRSRSELAATLRRSPG